METQSVWRRGHFLFDVHSNHSLESKNRGSLHGILVTHSNCESLAAAADHGLIYHHHLSGASRNMSTARNNERLSASRSSSYPVVSIRHYCVGGELYQGNDFDVFGQEPVGLSASLAPVQDDPFSFCGGLLFCNAKKNNNKRSVSPNRNDTDKKRQRHS